MKTSISYPDKLPDSFNNYGAETSQATGRRFNPHRPLQSSQQLCVELHLLAAWVENGRVICSVSVPAADGRKELLKADPNAKKWLRAYVGGDELISGEWRWCLWLKDADPGELKASKPIAQRLDRVRAGRLKSPTKSVQAYAKYPTLFTQDRQPDMPYLAIPEVSSETREYIPMAVLSPDIIASNKLQIIPGAPLLYFGVLTSAMHMAWMRVVGGRLKSDYSYSPAIYNSFPWPRMTPAQVNQVEAFAQSILDVRKNFPRCTLDDLYDPDNMPPALRQAHAALDHTIDRLYRKAPFRFERERVEHLFQLHETLSAPLQAAVSANQRRNRCPEMLPGHGKRAP